MTIQEENRERVDIVFPDDNRVRIDPTKVRPYYWVGEIESTFPSGDGGVGTGTLIGDRYILTCAHMVYQEEWGGRAKQVKFTLARNGKVAPYSQLTAESFEIPELYAKYSPLPPDKNGNVKDYTQYLYDYALVRLSQPLAPDGMSYPTIYVASDDQLRDEQYDIAGYPDDKPSGTMWNGSGKLQSTQPEEFLFYKISTCNGQSGSAVRSAGRSRPDVPRVVGIHVAGSLDLKSNFAVRINEEVYETIMGWLDLKK